MRAARIVLVATVLATGLLPSLAPTPVAAARPDLTLVSESIYEVRPTEGRVAVTVRMTATNHLRDTVARRFYFRTAVLTVLPGVSNLRITGGGGDPTVTVTSATETYTNLKVDFGGMLAARKSTKLTLTFDLRDAGGAPDRAVRVSPSLVTFTAWAFATPDTPGSSVEVRLPAGYGVTVGGGPLVGPAPVASGVERWTSGTLEAPLEFVAEVAADRPSEYEETTREVPLAEGSATVLLRSWPDDPAWRDRIASLVDRALPVLQREIGLPWPIEGPLAIHEALILGPGGYAGLFDPTAGEVEIAYAAPDAVVLHELAHAWFNGRFVADRWVAEAFASYYADLAAVELGLEPTPVPAVEPGERIPLNAWGPSGSESAAAETYAYSASLELARAVADRAGEDGLREVWALATRGMGAYGADPAAEDASPRPPDWRGLLDLLEETTGEDFGNLWRTYVARPEDLGALADREIARRHYAESATLAGNWELPPSVRDAMRAWQFDVAEERLRVVDDVLSQRTALETTAAAAGLELPSVLREAFEGSRGPEAAVAEATAEQVTVDAIVSARAARPAGSGTVDNLIIGIGLLTEQPEVQLGAAEAALANGDVQAAYVAANSAETSWSNAAGAGRSRIVSAALLFLALVLFAGLLQRERRRQTARALRTG